MQDTVPSRHILIIEDNADIRDSLKIILELDGHHVEVAESGRVGLELALATRPEVALIDIGLPELDGFEVAEQIRAAPDGQQLFLIAMTGHGEQEHRERAITAGFNAHLVKPPDQTRLNQLLTTLSD